MTPSARRLTLPITLLAVTVVFGYVLMRFTVQPGLASFADDSVSYLVMAQVWSPWHEASAAVRDIFPHEVFYPPLLPLLLALFDAGRDIALAHVICAVLLAGSLPLLYLVGGRWLDSRAAALAAALLFCLMPGVWLNAKGILSEPLFLIVLLALMFELATRKRTGVLSLLFGSLVLTRAIGCTMAAGYLVWALLASGGSIGARLRSAVPALIGLALYGAWLLLRPATTSDDYSAYGSDTISQLLHAPLTLGGRIAEQATSFADGWSEALLIYWTAGHSATHSVALAIGAIAVIGWLYRLVRRLPDAWMIAGYCGVLLIWPFPGQMLRFLLPILPVLVLYAFCAARLLSQRASGSALPAATLAIFIATLCAPPLVFLSARAAAGKDNAYATITEWYGSADVTVAAARAQTHLDLFATLARVGELTTQNDRVAWVAPAYVALLADRFAVALPPAALAPDPYRRALTDSGATYALLSTYHPRDTVHTTAWQAGVAALDDDEPVYVGRHPDGTVYAALWRLRAGEP